jgi:hypothetical protein
MAIKSVLTDFFIDAIAFCDQGDHGSAGQKFH